MVRVLVGSAFLVVLLTPFWALAAPPALTPSDLARLGRGEIVFKTDLPFADGAASGNGGTAVALLRADVEAVWRILTDFGHYAGLFPRLMESEIINQEGPRARVRFHVAVGLFNFRFTVAQNVLWGERRIQWRLDRSQANDLFYDTWGYWQLDPAPGGQVLVTYAMGSQTVLPAFLTRGSEQDSVVKTISALKARAERTRAGAAN